MRVLVARKPDSPRGPGDVWSAMHNEIVVAPFVCQDAECVCDHVHQGIVSHGYSTEVQVADVDTSLESVVAACQAHLGISQWAAVIEHSAQMDSLAADLVDDMAQTAGRFPIGTVLNVEFDHSEAEWRFTAR